MKPHCIFAISLALSTPLAHAAIFVINNLNTAGEGLNDPTVVAALPSNPHTTLGEQRLYVLQAAVNQWGTLLQSSRPIIVDATFEPLACTSTAAVLGSAAPQSVHQNFANAPVANVWYSQALANSLATTDLSALSDIRARFSSTLDSGCMSGTPGWYYSTLASDTTADGRIALLPVVFHELAHGLGFQTFTSSNTGAFNAGVPSIWDTFLADAVTGTTWINMPDNAARQASAISDPNLIWTGPIVTAAKNNFLGPAPTLMVNLPATIAGQRAALPATFGATVPAKGIIGDVVAAVDSGGANLLDGCESISNDVSGKIALMVRGNCNVTVKIMNAQTAGAIAALMHHNTAAGLPSMAGTNAAVNISSYGISQADGNTIRAELSLPSVVNVTLGYGTQMAGTTLSGGTPFVRMHAPNPSQGGTVAHFTLDAFPSLLMEPAYPAQYNEADLTIPLFEDIGWQVTVPTSLLPFQDGFE